MTIQEESVQALHLTLRCKGHKLATATGFIVEHFSKPYLVTNWHVFSGLAPITHKILFDQVAVPDEVVIRHLASPGNKLLWVEKSQNLYDEEGNKLWLEDPHHGEKIDVAALPLTDIEGAHLKPVDYHPTPKAQQLSVGVAEAVSVIGYPFGNLKASGLGIWATGFVATEIDSLYDELPVFLIDCRTREGQSGSMVVALRTGAAKFEDSIKALSTPFTNFLGIYSGRINAESDIGKVWKKEIIGRLFNDRSGIDAWGISGL